jgi:hypothetical protein
MGTGGVLVNTFGWLVGTGPGSGFGLLILLCGISGALIGIAAYLIPSVRNVDQLVPDFRPFPPAGVVKRVQMLRTRKNARKAKRGSQKIVRERTPLPPNKS